MGKTRKVYRRRKTLHKRRGGTKQNSSIKVPYRITGTQSALTLRNKLLKQPKSSNKWPKGLSSIDAIEANRRRRSAKSEKETEYKKKLRQAIKNIQSIL